MSVSRRRRRIMLALDLMSLACSLMAIITANRKQKQMRQP